MTSSLTPMFQQYHRIKAEHRDAILLFRMGDFYEMFFEDALRASEALQITLTARAGGSDVEVPMCGVPVAAADGYIARLVAAGFRVAICDQVEDPRAAKGLVRREVVRVVTAGTVTDPDQLDSRENHYLASLWCDPDGLGAAYLDLSTGDFRLAEIPGERRWEALADQLASFAPREVLVPEGSDWAGSLPRAALDGAPVQEHAAWTFELGTARRALEEQMRAVSLEGFGVADLPRAIRAGGALIHYLRDTQKADLAHVNRMSLYRESEHLLLDAATVRNLEVVRSADGGRAASLLGVLDRSRTPMGGRLLQSWALRPSRRLEVIEARHAAVAELVAAGEARERLVADLSGVRDLERLLCRCTLGTATPRDLGALRDSLGRLPAVGERLRAFTAPLLGDLAAGFDDLRDLGAALAAALVDRPPLASREGGIIRAGHHPGVDELRSTGSDARQILARLEARERERTGIGSLKVRHNRVFGYYIEVSNPNLAMVPPDYLRRQTLANAERFITPELKEQEAKILGAQDRLVELEHELFVALRGQVAATAGRIRGTAAAVAAADALAALAEVAAGRGYVRPRMHEGRSLSVRDGRHPVVEAIRSEERFIPNDVMLDAEERQIVLLTGPNMGGKSTFLRQTALLCLMAQAGSFVPAREASLPLFDRIFCRAGAADNLAGGRSTFLVEMQETANILHNATDRSLVLLDEIGRGTSTFDGLSIAWAVVEHLHGRPGGRPLTLFATHYHELTELPVTLRRAVNQSIAVREWNDGIVFLRKVVEGAADQSYGIHVARLAGIPGAVLDRAREVLENLERGEFTRDGLPRIGGRRGAEGAGPAQMRLFADEDPALRELRERLGAADLDRLTPLEALNLLADLRRRVG
jgi:DNA mismatch repair protein MutS